MHKIVQKILFASFSFNAIFNSLQACPFEEHKKIQMIQDLEVIKHNYEIGYAPAEWKREYAGWDLNEAFEDAKSRILATPSITTKQFQQIVRDFANTMKDYHVEVIFFSTEAASLPFSVRGVEGRYFIDWVDALRLPAAYYGIRAGDELLEFDERPIAEVMADIEKEGNKASNPNTDRTLAEMKLTVRTGLAGDSVPKGSVLVTTRSAKTDKMITHQLRWSYTPEHVKNPLDFIQTLDFISFLHPNSKKEKPKVELPKISMANPLHQAYVQKYANREGGLGSRKSFLPVLGELLWSSENDRENNQEEDEQSFFWHAYIYNHPQGYNIGYIRIPHYLISLEDTKEFGKILSVMEENTDALVIDQLHNIGGFVDIQYILASILTHKPLKTPYHRIKITQKEVFDAYLRLERIKLIEMIVAADYERNSDQKEDEEEEEEWRVNYQTLLFLKAYYELVLEDWNNGQTLTRPTPILGVDKINPHPKYQYSKPIVMLIDEMDFSGGDFMPAVLQDNNRAVLFGNRTAGAGGYVFGFQFPNTHGIAACSYTASIAERTNLQKIENLGVTPDIHYQITLDDVQNGYRGYAEAVNQTIDALLGFPNKVEYD